MMYSCIGSSASRSSSRGHFNEIWRTNDKGEERKWLHYDEDRRLIFCLYCIKHSTSRSSRFVKGSDSLNKTCIESHEQGARHISAKNIEEGKKIPFLTFIGLFCVFIFTCIYTGSPGIKKWKHSNTRFNKKWLTNDKGEERKWLHYDADKHLMFCLYCIKHCTDRSASFVKGSERMEHILVKSHERTIHHISAKNIEEGKKILFVFLSLLT